jgi:hypothetical protein
MRERKKIVAARKVNKEEFERQKVDGLFSVEGHPILLFLFFLRHKPCFFFHCFFVARIFNKSGFNRG